MDSFQQPAFSFTMPTGDFDPDRVPIDGEQYLQRVFYERNKCPAVVVKPFKQNVNKDTDANEGLATRSIWDQYAEVTFKNLNYQCFSFSFSKNPFFRRT